jgi:hypothetical protein
MTDRWNPKWVTRPVEREARQIAYQLLEAADELERWSARR